MHSVKSLGSGRYWANDLDPQDSSGTESPVRQDDADLQPIFELDEIQTPSHSQGSSHPKPNRRESNLPPLGRLRREAPSRITGIHQLEFPGMFVEGFRDGHVGFNIPGVLQDSLKPTDSIELKIKLSTPYNVTVGYDSVTHCDSSNGQQRHSFETSDVTNHSVSHPNMTTHPVGRFGASWLGTATEEDTNRLDLPDSPSTNFTEGSSLFRSHDHCTSNEATTVHFSCTDVGVSVGNPNSPPDGTNNAQYFSFISRFGEDSTDSGLQSSNCERLDEGDETGERYTADIQAQFSAVTSRFLQFNIR
ncbi:unnamed protein product [Calicophoron daubneyi]|uniref:Uncharacterized protein n=1 Tax=Calicophoron daubneyi TaxID=300641 RepID=A0AAV2TN96_CALDB